MGTLGIIESFVVVLAAVEKRRERRVKRVLGRDIVEGFFFYGKFEIYGL